MKFLYVFLCLIYSLNCASFSQLSRVDKFSKISLIKIKSLNLSSGGFPNDEENHKSTEDRQHGTGSNDCSSSSSSSNDHEEGEEEGLSPFGRVPLKSPRPHRRKQWKKRSEKRSPFSDSDSDKETKAPLGGMPLKSPRPRRRKPW